MNFGKKGSDPGANTFNEFGDLIGHLLDEDNGGMVNGAT